MAAVAEDIQSFLSDINRTDRQLQRDYNNGDIFEGSTKENRSLNA
jgi:hypothetical protein